MAFFETESPAAKGNGYFLDEVSEGFEAGAKDMMTELNKAEEALEKDPSNPAVLARYQAKLQEYTLFRNAQTSTVKAYKDIGAAIIQNFR
ncbi:type III secretion system needle filament subunit SctF [Erwinia piriflorinigrans]|uniref:Protein mxiH n=1 Tax=Erwinia piriflorinigrans CFBP 5888 TaxID=1161919 RepID=V5Z4H3_9GAMM|nr:type III secretion system needle filament subunit SctF [Erwinia piriflorinigrans]CCG86221.1 Protein mxiH [Erwinia piriflorinigrans CFBP 5888]